MLVYLKDSVWEGELLQNRHNSVCCGTVYIWQRTGLPTVRYFYVRGRVLRNGGLSSLPLVGHIKHLSYKCEDPSLNPRNPLKQGTTGCFCNSSDSPWRLEAEMENP